MKYQSGLIALIIAGAASVAAAQETKIGSTSVILTVPQGQCQVGSEKGEASRVEKLRELLAPENHLLATYADCNELTKSRSDDQAEVQNFAHYMVPTHTINQILPEGGLAQICGILRSRNEDFAASLLQGRAKDIERIFDGLKINESKFLGVLMEGPKVCYSGQIQKLSDGSGKEAIQVGINAMLEIKGKFVAYYLYAPNRDSDSISKLLITHQANVAALISSNSK
jgi:hypothetical protein